MKPKPSHSIQTLYTILNNIEVYEEPVPWTKKMPHCPVKFKASEENRIVYESLYCCLGFGIKFHFYFC